MGSHFHLLEVNRALAFDREAAFGIRQDLPAGAAARFEPGDRKDAAPVAISGVRRVGGRNSLARGSLDPPEMRRQSLESATRRGFARPPTVSAWPTLP